MDSLKSVLFSVVVLALLVQETRGEQPFPRPDNVQWVSNNFKSILTWTPVPGDHTYTVLYSETDTDWQITPDCVSNSDNECDDLTNQLFPLDSSDWQITPDCVRISDNECDLTNQLFPLDRTYSAKVETESTSRSNSDPDELPNTLSKHFNPYRETEITAVSFSLETGDNSSAVLQITDPLTNVYKQGRMLNIRDVFQKDLMYKIIYYKAGSTRKKEAVFESNMAEFPDLEPQQSYCFSVAAFIPSRPTHSQLGSWSQHQCTPGSKPFLEVPALVVFFILLTLLIAIVVTLVICCRRRLR